MRDGVGASGNQQHQPNRRIIRLRRKGEERVGIVMEHLELSRPSRSRVYVGHFLAQERMGEAVVHVADSRGHDCWPRHHGLGFAGQLVRGVHVGWCLLWFAVVVDADHHL